VRTLFIEPGSPWENRYIEGLNGKPTGSLPACEVFETMLKAKVLIERYAARCNTMPDGRLGYRPTAPDAIVPWTRLRSSAEEVLPGPE
jgi:hypothetical protein